MAHVRELKNARGGGIWLCGAGRLAASLIEEIDHLVLKVNPVTIGDGRPLFDGAFAPQSWQRESTTTFDLGVVLVEYSRLP